MNFRWTLLFGLLLFSSQALAGKCDCQKHSATASGPGKCTRAENSSKCTIDYEDRSNEDDGRQLEALEKVVNIGSQIDGVNFASEDYIDDFQFSDPNQINPALFDNPAAFDMSVAVDFIKSSLMDGDGTLSNEVIDFVENKFIPDYVVNDELDFLPVLLESGCFIMEEGDLILSMNVRHNLGDCVSVR